VKTAIVLQFAARRCIQPRRRCSDLFDGGECARDGTPRGPWGARGRANNSVSPLLSREATLRSQRRPINVGGSSPARTRPPTLHTHLACIDSTLFWRSTTSHVCCRRDLWRSPTLKQSIHELCTQKWLYRKIRFNIVATWVLRISMTVHCTVCTCAKVVYRMFSNFAKYTEATDLKRGDSFNI